MQFHTLYLDETKIMTERGIIIGTFVKKNKILSFIETLKNEFGIRLEKLFIYSIDTNKREYLVTFKTFDKDRFIKNLGNATVMHVKNGCLFSINALNKLIEKDNEGSELPNNEFVVDWDKYKDKLIIITNGELSISNLSKIEDKSLFFN
jgi:hypothetical protein